MPIVPEDANYNDELADDERRWKWRREEDATSSSWFGGGGIPPWAKGILAIGPTAAIALILVYTLAKQLPDMVAHQTAIETALIVHQRSADQQTVMLSQILRAMQRVCSNTAKNEEERQRCFD